ncbi:hypothetical protein EDM58_21515, partial [Brevibacillus panacihumi]
IIRKREKAPGGLGSLLGGFTGRLPLQRRNRVQKQPLRRSASRLDAKNVFRLFRSGLVKIPNAFAFFPFSSASLSCLPNLTLWNLMEYLKIKKPRKPYQSRKLSV